jgi:DNA-binding NtrC family response regulator
MVTDGRFRADLYYRLHVLPLHLPPLRGRLDDLPALSEAFVEDITRRGGLPPRSLAPGALAWLARQRWPGNIRELRNVLEQALLFSDDAVLDERHFAAVRSGALPFDARPDAPAAPARGRDGNGDGHGEPRAFPAQALDALGALGAADAGASGGASHSLATLPSALPTLSQRVASLEHEAIRDALLATNGNRVAAAKRLKISRATLYERLARYPDLALAVPGRRGRP